MKTICVVTSTRADYGLLYSSIKSLLELGTLQVKLVATGTHLSAKHGQTVDAIVADGLKVDERIDLEISGDRPGDIARVMSVALINFSAYFEKNRPDLLLILGDRYEIFSVVQAALVHNIPVAHIHGGEVTEGAIDDSIRHSITKMSHLHFPSTLEHAARVIQLGERPSTVFMLGAPGLDNIVNLKLLDREELEKSIGVKLGKKNILLTYHPVTTDERISETETTNFFKALSGLESDVEFFLTMPNADAYSSHIEKEIQKFKDQFPSRVHTFKSLGQLRYLSLMKQVDVIAGNSSSGIIEAPFMAKAVVNVGVRQKGRSSDFHVLHATSELDDIEEKIKLALSDEFQKKCSVPSILYGAGATGQKIAAICNEKIATITSVKSFYDIKV